jgi:hypothetical protein
MSAKQLLEDLKMEKPAITIPLAWGYVLVPIFLLLGLLGFVAGLIYAMVALGYGVGLATVQSMDDWARRARERIAANDAATEARRQPAHQQAKKLATGITLKCVDGGWWEPRCHCGWWADSVPKWEDAARLGGMHAELHKDPGGLRVNEYGNPPYWLVNCRCGWWAERGAEDDALLAGSDHLRMFHVGRGNLS